MEKIERPIINIETPVRAFSSFEQQTKSQLQILRQYGVEQFDVVGSSSGAIAATHLAAHAQADVEDLVTISIPNRGQIGDYALHMPANSDGYVNLLRHKRGELGQVVGPRALLIYVRKFLNLFIRRKKFRTSLNECRPCWRLDALDSIAGTGDKITDYKVTYESCVSEMTCIQIVNVVPRD